ncbi:MAG: F0F1 ATP synthase subunit A [Sphingomonadaceae bacterium]|nr:F0F1 ATP synthase subunit A [Sphingomonadaceae bacterium]
MADPLHQFVITRTIPIEVAGIDLSFTNASAWMLIVTGLASTLLLAGLRKPQLVPTRTQSAVEMLYEVVDETIVSSAGPEARKFFPLIFTTFLFILFANLAGLLPYSFTVTSHIAVTFAMALIAFVGITLVGIFTQGFGFLRMFAPSGVPPIMYIILTPIEIVGYFIRPISLSVRLFANMMAGHVLLKVLAGFVVSLGVFGIFPLLVVVAMTALETLVAVLQAYVFTVLLCVYLNDALHAHH